MTSFRLNGDVSRIERSQNDKKRNRRDPGVCVWGGGSGERVNTFAYGLKGEKKRPAGGGVSARHGRKESQVYSRSAPALAACARMKYVCVCARARV